MRAKRTAAAPATMPADRLELQTITVHGRIVERGTELTIAGIRGRCEFVRYVRNDRTGAEWIDVLTSRGFSRTVRPSSVSTVHRAQRAA